MAFSPVVRCNRLIHTATKLVFTRNVYRRSTCATRRPTLQANTINLATIRHRSHGKDERFWCCRGGGGSGLPERCLVCCDKPKAPGFARKTTVLAKDEKESNRRMASTTGENRKRNEKKSTEQEEAHFVSRVTVILTRKKERDYLLNLHMSLSTCFGT